MYRKSSNTFLYGRKRKTNKIVNVPNRFFFTNIFSYSENKFKKFLNRTGSFGISPGFDVPYKRNDYKKQIALGFSNKEKRKRHLTRIKIFKQHYRFLRNRIIKNKKKRITYIKHLKHIKYIKKELKLLIYLITKKKNNITFNKQFIKQVINKFINNLFNLKSKKKNNNFNGFLITR